MASFFRKVKDSILIELSTESISLLLCRNGKIAGSDSRKIPPEIKGNEFQEDNFIHQFFEQYKKDFNLEDGLPVYLFLQKVSFSLKIAELPAVSETKLRSLIFWDLGSYFNFETDDIYWDFKVLENLSGGNCRVAIAAVKKTEWDRISAIVKSTGFVLSGLEATPVSFMNLLEHQKDAKGQTAAVYFSDEAVNVTLLVNGFPLFYRELSFTDFSEEGLAKIHEKWEHTVAFIQASYRVFINKIMVCGKIPAGTEKNLDRVFGSDYKVLNSLAGVTSVIEHLPLAASAVAEGPAFSVRRLTADVEIPREKISANVKIPGVNPAYAAVSVLCLALITYAVLVFQNHRLAESLEQASLRYRNHYPLIHQQTELKNQISQLTKKQDLFSQMVGDRFDLTLFFKYLSDKIPEATWLSTFSSSLEDGKALIKISGYTGDYEGQISFLEKIKKEKGISDLVFGNMKQIVKNEKQAWEFSFSLKLSKEFSND